VVQDHRRLFKMKRFDEAIAAWQRALAGDEADRSPTSGQDQMPRQSRRQ
jgi:hypothetical protein